MKKKTYLTLAAGLLLAGCAVDDQQGAAPTTSSNNSIAFNMQTASQIRAGETDANKLNKMFIVWGEKGEDQTATSPAAAEESNTVFKNYVVEYKENSAITGTSNTANWEYVGMTPFTENVTPNIGTGLGQTIKYWDDTAESYTFTAVSAKKDDISSGKVIITKNPTGTSTVNSVYEKGYTVQVKKDASINDIYFSDRNYIAKGDEGYTHKAVTMSFRSFMSKIRFGIYETMPGYKVVITGIKYNTNTEHKSTDDDKSFGVDGNFVVAGDKTTYTVTYESEGTNKNKAKVALGEGASTQSYLNTEGTQWLSTSWTSKETNTPVATEATSPTYDQKDGVYTTIMPNPSNEKEMTLTIKYDLYSEDTGEKISVGYKTVKVPAKYCQWKSNYAYTYLFKITDQNTGLNPISFDAVVVTDENGTWEDITEVDEPSITTFGVTTDNKIVTGKNEYEAGNSIYAVVMDKNDGGTYSAQSLTATNIKLYTVATTDETNFPITEANVAQSIANEKSAYKDKITCTAVSMEGDTPAASIVTSVPAEDGTTKAISALKWTPSAAATYAIEYSKEAKKYYKIVKVAAAASASPAKKH